MTCIGMATTSKREVILRLRLTLAATKRTTIEPVEGGPDPKRKCDVKTKLTIEY